MPISADYRDIQLFHLLSSKDALPDYEYRKVAVDGVYQHDKEILLGPRTRGDGQVGYFIITPLVRENGTTILVKRGWVSMAKKERHTRPDSLTQGVVHVEGLLRTSEKVRMGYTLWIRGISWTHSSICRPTHLHPTMILYATNGIGPMWMLWRILQGQSLCL